MSDEDSSDSSDEVNNEICLKLRDTCTLSSGSAALYSSITEVGDNETENLSIGNKIIVKSDETLAFNNLSSNKISTFENIEIVDSKNVHVGDVININGPIYINEFSPTINQTINIESKKTFPIVSRLVWCAQPPLDPNDVLPFEKRPKYIIIHHSATEEGYTQCENNYIIRHIQQYHIESQNWNDIAYNFLIGAEGSVYQGRGFNVVGAHTMGYNHVSIAICFVGCYIKTLPTKLALEKAKALIKHCIEIGALDENYSLLAHCQLRSSENPGSMLFQEIQTWDRWDSKVDLNHPLCLDE